MNDYYTVRFYCMILEIHKERLQFFVIRVIISKRSLRAVILGKLLAAFVFVT